MPYVISAPPSLHKFNNKEFLSYFDTEKEAKEWIRKQLRTDEAYFMDIILDFGLHFKTDKTRWLGPCLKNKSYRFPSRKEMMDYLVIPDNNFNTFIDTHKDLIF